MRVLAIGAHPDDVELLCGGTMAHFVREGHEVWFGVATSGNVGSPTLSREEIGEIRHREAEAACAVLGARLIWMGFDDEWLFNDRETRSRFIDCLREARPGLVIAHSPSDYHPDHRVCGQVAIDSRIPAAVRLVETSLPALEEVPRVVMMDTVGKTAFEPEAYVDVSDVLDIKKEMLSCHESQAGWLRAIFGMSYMEFAEAQARARGDEVGVQYAEGFRDVKTYPVASGVEMLPRRVR